ncbi:MAG TPA: carboxypeptidase-like regulatory domain-containing protein, partial [Terriglobales bacterium]|nr:carboxypeptidase-like regulatory domain-containing protein [Terriglobales bacterium]
MQSARRSGMKCFVGCLLVMLSAFAVAQSDRGTIAGSVVDSTGAAIKDATVTLRGVDTGAAYTTKSTGDGVYRISDVHIGKYDVTVEAPGFKSSVQTGVQIQINTTAALNVTLQPGSVN